MFYAGLVFLRIFSITKHPKFILKYAFHSCFQIQCYFDYYMFTSLVKAQFLERVLSVSQILDLIRWFPYAQPDTQLRTTLVSG